MLDFYIFLGPDPNMVIQQYQQVIGKCLHPNMAICGHLPHMPIPVSTTIPSPLSWGVVSSPQPSHPQPLQHIRGQQSPNFPLPLLSFQDAAVVLGHPIHAPSLPL